MNIYRCPIDGNYTSYDKLKNQHVVAQGWAASEDVSFFIEEEDITRFLPIFSTKKDLGKVNTVFNLLTHEAKAGDVFIATIGGEICGLCELPEKFTYVYLCGDECNEYANCLFPVNWIDWKIFCSEFNQISNPRSPGPFTRINSSNVATYVNMHWNSFKSNESVVLQPSECQNSLEMYMQDRPNKIIQSRNNFQRRLNTMQAKNCLETLKQLLEKCHNLILTGAPGTGKTYLAKQIACKMIFGDFFTPEEIDADLEKKKKFSNQYGFVQFHPSYDYSDFIEGLRPIPPGENGNVCFARQDGTFKSFCKEAVLSSLDNGVDNFEIAWQGLVDVLNEKNFIKVTNLSGTGEFEVELNEYGTGLASRTYASEDEKATHNWTNGRSKFFNKDQLYKIYQGLSGVPNGGHDNYRKAVINMMKKDFGLRDFKAGVENVVRKQNYVFIIDEINRGDIAKIFGELFFALDPGYRGKNGCVETQYANLIDDKDIFKRGFYIPSNVYVIGTMNDIDRNVESMDFAVRRRFTWKKIFPEDTQDAILADLEDDVAKEAKSRMNSLNIAIRAEKAQLGENFCIGAAYFKNVDNSQEKWINLWNFHLYPLLEEYVRGLPDADILLKKFEAAYNGKTQDNANTQG